MSRRILRRSFIAVTVLVFSTAAAAAAPPGAPRDFNGDGFDDLAIGVPREGFGAVVSGGLFHVLHGSGNGIRADGSQRWHQNRAGIVDQVEAQDAFGEPLVIGDFNGDGFSDIATAATYETLEGSGDAEAGAVHVLYGSDSGLRRQGSQQFTQDTPGVSDRAEDFDYFGTSLAAGDFNGDGFDDLVVGVSYETVGGVTNAGVAHVFYGSPSGITTAGDQYWHRGRVEVAGDLMEGDFFADELATGDFDGDGFDDLVLRGSQAKSGDPEFAGSITILHGSARGLVSAGAQYWDQDSPGIADKPEDRDSFGLALSAGDFNGDGFDDLAVGAPGEMIDGEDHAGAVHILFGSQAGLTTGGAQFWHQNVAGVHTQASADDGFGSTLIAGDFDGDGNDDLAIGVSGEDVMNIPNSGAIHVLYGSNQGLSADGSHFLSQASNGLEGDLKTGDIFGSALTSGDFNGDGFVDLAVSAMLKDVNGVTNAGAVHVLAGSSRGIKTRGSQFWHQDSPGVGDRAEESDAFGESLGR